MLSDEKTLEYIRAAKEGDSFAKEELITHNTSLIKSIVKRYLNKGVDYDDLFQLASMGLLKAITGFDESYGVKFSTYAVPMIAGEIKRFMRDDGSIKVSRAIKFAAKNMNRYIEDFSAAHGRAPTVKEISKEFGVEESEVVFTLGSTRMPLSIYDQNDYKDEKSRELLDKLPAVDQSGRDGGKNAVENRFGKTSRAREKDHHAAVFPRYDAERGRRSDRRFAGADLADRKQNRKRHEKTTQLLNIFPIRSSNCEYEETSADCRCCGNERAGRARELFPRLYTHGG